MLMTKKPTDRARTSSAKNSPLPRGASRENDTNGWLTRNQSADLLHMSVSSIANWERRGKLHPRYAYRPDSRGIEHRVSVYDPDELQRLPPQVFRAPIPRQPGEVAAQCFELFDQGKTMREVVVELRETPEYVRSIYEHWLDTGGADLVITAEAKQALEKIVGPFDSVTELVEHVSKLAA